MIEVHILWKHLRALFLFFINSCGGSLPVYILYIKENSFSFRWNINEMESLFYFIWTNSTRWYDIFKLVSDACFPYLFSSPFLFHRIKVVWKTTCDLANKRIKPVKLSTHTTYICIMHKCIWYAISKSFYYKMVALKLNAFAFWSF